MSQSRVQTLQTRASPARGGSGDESAATPGSFACVIPSCKKVFRRKEHLTRHLKSHDKQLQYVCHICGRRYARSDVLKRHIEFHPSGYKSKRDFVACTRCRESKTKCDDDSPCRPCRRRALECVRAGSARETVNADGATPESRTASSSSPLSSILTPDGSKLGEYLARDAVVVQRRLGVYFTGVHPTWPILQPFVVTTTTSGIPGLLVASIMMLAGWLEGDPDHLALFPLVLGEILEAQMEPNPPLHVLQAMALCLIYSMHCLADEDMALKVTRLHHTLVTACRFSGIFVSQRGILYASTYVSTEEEQQEQQEQRNRLAFAVLRLDAYLSALMDFPPLIRPQELSMPISESTCWVHVASEEERRRLLDGEPALRKKTSFSFRVHDLFGDQRSNALASPWTRMDYHFILCAIQSGVWEVSHQAFRTVPDDLHSRTHFQDLRPNWREYLNTWVSSLENDCQLRKEYFIGPPRDDISPQTLLLWHMTTIKLQAPPDLWELQGRYYKFRAASMPHKQGAQASLRSWQTSRTARVAVWHSAQIARIVSKEFALGSSSTRFRLNPLLIPALLMSAAIVCGYAYHVRGCPVCMGTAPMDLVHIFGAPDDCDRLTQWLENGEGLLANWGVDVFTGFPLCRCAIVLLYEWFHELLSYDRKADEALEILLNELKAGVW